MSLSQINEITTQGCDQGLCTLKNMNVHIFVSEHCEGICHLAEFSIVTDNFVNEPK